MGTTAQKGTTKNRVARPWWRRMRWKRLTILVVAGLVFLFVAFVSLEYLLATIPSPNEISTAQSAIVVDDTGKQIGYIHADANRVSVPLSEMPESLRQAVIATEDRHFYSHHGIVVTSIFRAALSNAFGHGSQGGSTITQQYVKNAFVGNKRSLFRKIREAVLAVKLEHRESKDRILEDYLNTIYFGRGAYGCEAAAQSYFGRHCSQLDLPQSATLAGIIKAPELYDPIRNPETSRARRDQVLDFMVRDKHITQAQADAIKKQKVGTRARSVSGFAAHYLEELRHDLEDRLGPRELYGGNVKVVASLNVDAQRAAENAVKAVWPKPSQPDVALVAIDPKTGYVRALVGSRSYTQRELDLATDAHRQPGSTFKPAVLATAFDENISPNETFDAPARIDAPGYPKPVENYDHKNYGRLTIAQATWESVNTVYIQLIHKVGAEHVVDMAHRLGIRSHLEPIDGLALGVNEVTPIELTNMFATFADRGAYHPPLFAEMVTVHGRVVYRAKTGGDETVDRKVADNVNGVLQGVVRQGTGTRANIGRPEAGKTGTTEQNADAWFAGYTPDLAAVVWNGFPDSRKSLRNLLSPTGCTAMFGGSCPAEIWKRFARVALADVPPTPFATPETIASTSTETSSSTPSPTPSTPPPSTPLPVTTAPAPKPTKSSPSPSPKPSQSPSPTGTPTGGQSP
ncbi:MAG: transglycosylase domain-containing protein [Actinomycetota bacterium]